MNDRNNVDNTNVDVGSVLLVECKERMNGVSATYRSTVADTHVVPILDKIILTLLGIMILVAIYCNWEMQTNAAENTVYVDADYMQEQFGSYKTYAVLTDGQGNYVTIYSEVDIAVSTSTYNIYSFNTNNYMGYKTMKIEDGVLYVDENSSSNYNRFTVTQTYKYLGVDTAFNDIVYSNNDVKAIMWVNGSPRISEEVVHSVADNIGSKPVIDEPTEPSEPSITIDCKFTDENIVEKLDLLIENINSLTQTIVLKIDLILTLLIIFMALKMFSPLANNHKRGLQKKEKQ